MYVVLYYMGLHCDTHTHTHTQTVSIYPHRTGVVMVASLVQLLSGDDFVVMVGAGQVMSLVVLPTPCLVRRQLALHYHAGDRRDN